MDIFFPLFPDGIFLLFAVMRNKDVGPVDSKRRNLKRFFFFLNQDQEDKNGGSPFLQPWSAEVHSPIEVLSLNTGCLERHYDGWRTDGCGDSSSRCCVDPVQTFTAVFGPV